MLEKGGLAAGGLVWTLSSVSLGLQLVRPEHSLTEPKVSGSQRPSNP